MKKICVMSVFDFQILITDGVTYLQYNFCIINVSWVVVAPYLLPDNVGWLQPETILMTQALVFDKLK